MILSSTNERKLLYPYKKKPGVLFDVGMKAWAVSKQLQQKLKATEILFLMRMLQISWMAEKLNQCYEKQTHHND